MLNWIFIVVAMGASGANTSSTSSSSAIVTAPEPAAEIDMSDGFGTDETAEAAPQYVAEPQVSLGKFTTALEVKPILSTTKASWMAVREYDGQDLLYFTHLMSWRCGLLAVNYSVNGESMREWPLPACHDEAGWANAITPEDGLVYGTYALGSVQSVAIELIFDDLTRDSANFARNEILMP